MTIHFCGLPPVQLSLYLPLCSALRQSQPENHECVLFCRSVPQPNIVTPSMRGPATIERVPMFGSVRITAARRVVPPSRGPSCAAIVHRRPPCRPTPPPIRTSNSTRAHMPSDYRDGTELSTRPIPPADSGRPIAQPCPQRDSLCKQRLNSCVFACAAIVVILK